MTFNSIFGRIITRNISTYIPLYREHLKDCRTVLDIGSGSGMQAKLINKSLKKINIICLDVKDYLWDENKDLPIVVYDGKRIPFKENSYDASLLFFVLHHAVDKEMLLKEALRVCRKYVLIFEETYNNPIQNLLMILYDIFINVLIFGGSISKPQFYTRERWRETFKRQKIKRVEEKVFLRKWYYPPQRVFFVLHK